MTWKLFNEPPTPGTRFVALHCDMGGAEVYLYGEDRHVYDAHGVDVFESEIADSGMADWLFDMGFVFWMPLPEGQRLFFEGVGG